MTQSVGSKSAVAYSAYLVRMWQEKEQTPWRASAQSTITGEKIYFANLADLFSFLQAQTITNPDADECLSTI